MTAFQLAILAAYYDWTPRALKLLFGLGDEPMVDPDREAVISLAITRGEEPDWIEEVLANGKRAQHAGA